MKEKAIQELLKFKIKTRQELDTAKRKIAKKHNISILLNSEILAVYRKAGKINVFLENLLRRRSIRTLSGVAPVAVLTMPYPCPGKCAYCPSEKNVPASYLSNEPAVMRAIRCNYDPYEQVKDRIRSLINNGHQPNKIELIVIGGTWSVLPEQYKYWYIAGCLAAANEYGRKFKRSYLKYNKKLKIEKIKKVLSRQQKKNENAEYGIVGITLETRPDYINEKELWQMRGLGCTRVELGVQAIDDKILKINKRGHGTKEVVDATKLLKDFGFKVTYHIMPGLPGSSVRKDFIMFKQIFKDERFQPDQIKFYPTVVTEGSLLHKWWKQNKYKPYTDKSLQQLIINCKKIVPEYVRIIRLIRDIPGESIIAGNMITNLRQLLQNKGIKCRCIRCREARDQKVAVKNAKLKILKYKASGGEEYFISFESKNRKVLYGFCRLRLPGKDKKPNPEYLKSGFDDTALIRELHVYGELVPIGKQKKIQHSGLGKMLMAEAEKIAKERACQKIMVISGIGVRNYYRKLGYRLNKTYMEKKLK